MFQGFQLPRLEHSHGDDKWSPMVEVLPPDVSESDPERSWSKGRIFACTACDEQIRVTNPEDEQVEGR